ncbi:MULTISPECIES: serine hydrolase domain-containing protein [Streptomyces violaceusniger group]|uniref:Beta-lactamase-related domain-containing protein n=2 Tax=Streptomyces rhizosphaericus TaxID=114699 RepID=A0ABN1NU88_9ACTN|nr:MULTISPECIES: hypothetical protein [Streptomyces violaceusniger group]
MIGPLLNGDGPGGVVVRRGGVLARWGDPGRVEMAFSATKSVPALVAGIAFDDGLLRLDEPDCGSVEHGYDNAFADIGGVRVPVVSGGAHRGGGLRISALDLARIGRLCLSGGEWAGRRIVSRRWIEALWTPCAVKPEYGLTWWLNDGRVVWPQAPSTGRCARGNGGNHLLWVDPARDLTLVSRWGADVEALVAAVSEAVRPC